MLKKILNFLHLHTHLEYMGAIKTIYELKMQKDELEIENENLKKERDELKIEQAEKGILIEQLKEENKMLRKELKGCLKLRNKK
jgi:FtsZ-binding cell division protein ZapB